jgi:asparagine synthase (glutamine-hydrolysing)
MCGIAGYVLREPTGDRVGVLDALTAGIRGRGPDDEGVCLVSRADSRVLPFRTDRSVEGTARAHLHDAQGRAAHDLALVNTRFAILDPSPAGHQPFLSQDGAVVGVFNGEIYNHVEIRAELASLGVTCRTSCDTEVLVEGYRLWGDDVWPRLNGFWAAAMYHVGRRTLTLCRDRLGVAPLYLRQTADGLYFASSLAALRAVPPETRAADLDRVVGFIETSIKDGDRHTLLSDITTLPPATVATIAAADWRIRPDAERQYWSLPATRFRVSDLTIDEAARTLRELLFSAVELRLRSDVPVAFELSGGLDSSSIVAAAASLRPGIVTYTIEVPEENEEPFARAIRDRYDVDYRVLRDPEHDFMARASWFAAEMAEPFHSPNIYTHFRMRQRMKADGVDVVLAGAGGDEVLAGYEWQFWSRARQAMREEGHGREAMRYQAALAARQWSSWSELRARAGRVVNRVRDGRDPWRRGLDSSAAAGPAARHQAYRSLSFDEQRRYHFDTGLLPYYLRSNDQFTMLIPMEHRFPFLDYRIVEFGVRMPPAYLFHQGWTKYVLRKAMETLLPRAVVWRKHKMGFPFAYGRFLRQHAPALRSAIARVGAAGLDAMHGVSYEVALRTDPLRLWRICSTGLWLDACGIQLGPAPASCGDAGDLRPPSDGE